MSGWKKALTDYFASGIKEKGSRFLGVEVEHFIVDPVGKKAVPYSGDRGVRYIISELMRRYPGAAALYDEDLVGFETPEFNITIEPAAQFEISIAPKDSIRETEEVYREFEENLSDVTGSLGYAYVTQGCQPFTPVSDLELIPKERYRLMDAHFRKTGTGGIEMMRGTAALQVSVDYSSEEDFRKKLQAAYYLSPVLKLLCDCSPYFQGKRNSMPLRRTDIWRRVDPARCGILPGVFSPGYGFDDYADFIGGVAPIFIRKGNIIKPTGDKKVSEIYAHADVDSETAAHLLSMVFPDVRLKSFLEIRFADSVPLPFVLAYCAMLKGLILSDDGLDYASEKICGNGTAETDILCAEDLIMEKGWDADIYGRPAASLASELLDLAGSILDESEAGYLRAFRQVILCRGISEIPLNSSCGD